MGKREIGIAVLSDSPLANGICICTPCAFLCGPKALSRHSLSHSASHTNHKPLYRPLPHFVSLPACSAVNESMSQPIQVKPGELHLSRLSLLPRPASPAIQDSPLMDIILPFPQAHNMHLIVLFPPGLIFHCTVYSNMYVVIHFMIPDIDLNL